MNWTIRARQALTAAIGVSALALGCIAPADAAPPGRAYEMVTPPLKNGSMPFFGIGTIYGSVTAASADGDQVLWYTTTALPGDENSVPKARLSTRTATGWSTEAALPYPHNPLADSGQASPINDVTENFEARIVKTAERYDSLITAPYPLRTDLYRQTPDGVLEWVSRPEGGGGTSLPGLSDYEGRDADASHILFLSSETLVPAEAGQLASARALYMRSNGHTEMVNLTTEGTLINSCGAFLGGAHTQTAALRRTLSAVSRDGSRIFFSTPQVTSGACASVRRAVYIRSQGATTLISGSQRAVPDPLGTRPAYFQAATPDGGTVFFLSEEALTDDAADGTAGSFLLYAYDVPSGDLTLLTPNSGTPANVTGVVKVGEGPDGPRAYVVATQPIGDDGGAAGQSNLYLYEAGEFTFVGPVEPDSLVHLPTGPTGGTRNTQEANRLSRITDDGRMFMFDSNVSIPPYDAGGSKQIYLYDAERDELACPSCPADPADVHGDSTPFVDVLPPQTRRTRLPRNLTADARRAFFQTPNRLVSEDLNTVDDVYMWEDGAVQLISSGSGASTGSWFVDSARDGDDVLLLTGDRLVPQDVDDARDIYDARVGGREAPANPLSRPPCQGDACQSDPVVAPGVARPGSQLASGSGNIESKRVVARLRASAASRSFRGSRGRLRLGLSGAGTVRVSGPLVGSVRRAFARGGRHALRFGLSPKGRRALARHGALRTEVSIRFEPRAGTAKTTTVAVRFTNKMRKGR